MAFPPIRQDGTTGRCQLYITAVSAANVTVTSPGGAPVVNRTLTEGGLFVYDADCTDRTINDTETKVRHMERFFLATLKTPSKLNTIRHLNDILSMQDHTCKNEEKNKWKLQAVFYNFLLVSQIFFHYIILCDA